MIWRGIKWILKGTWAVIEVIVGLAMLIGLICLLWPIAPVLLIGSVWARADARREREAERRHREAMARHSGPWRNLPRRSTSTT